MLMTAGPLYFRALRTSSMLMPTTKESVTFACVPLSAQGGPVTTAARTVIQDTFLDRESFLYHTLTIPSCHKSTGQSWYLHPTG